jgi:hypothetical protein
MMSSSARFIENGFKTWSVSHYGPANDDDEPGGASATAVSDLSRDGLRSDKIVPKARSLP